MAFAWEDVKAMFNGGTRKRMLAAAIGSNSSSKSIENYHRSNHRSNLLEQSSMTQKSNDSGCPGMPHNAASATRATLAAARAACVAACVVQASASSSGKEVSIDEGYGGINEIPEREQLNKVGILLRTIKLSNTNYAMQTLHGSLKSLIVT